MNSLLNAGRAMLLKLLTACDAPGVKVLRSKWQTSVESVEADGARTTSVAAPNGAAMQLLVLRAPDDGRWKVEQRNFKEVVFDCPVMNRSDAMALYAKMQRQMLANAPVAGARGAGVFKWVALAVVLLVAFIFVPPAMTGGATAKTQPAAQQAAAQADAPRDAREPRLNATELQMLRTAAEKGGVRLSDSGKPFFIFSDPKCPFCRQLEPTLEKVGEGHQAVILPVAYKPGAKDAAQAVLCARDAKQAAGTWRAALANPDEPVKGIAKPDCSDGLNKLADNMTLFEMLKLTGTPTVITSTGRMFSGAASATPEQLRAALELQ